MAAANNGAGLASDCEASDGTEGRQSSAPPHIVKQAPNHARDAGFGGAARVPTCGRVAPHRC